MAVLLSPIGTLVDYWAERAPDRLAVAADQDRLSYRDWARRSDRAACALLAAGIGKGERVALLLPNSVDWVVVATAAWKVGATVVPLSTWSPVDEWSYQLRHSDASALFFLPSFLGRDYLNDLLTLCPELQQPGHQRTPTFPFLRLLVPVMPTGSTLLAESTLTSLLASGEAISQEHLTAASREVTLEDEAVILYTSGTTGRPKGVVHVHRALVGNGANIAQAMRLDEHDRNFSHFPFFFSAGLCNALMSTLAAGGGLVTQAVFEPGSALDLIERLGCTARALWPTAVRALVGHKNFRTDRVSRATKGLRPLGLQHPELGLSEERGVSMYGMTETCTAFTCTDADDPPQVKLETNGRPFPGTALRIVDPDTGAVLPPGRVGEIRVRGYNVLRRYHKVSPEETFDDDGFFATGDRGMVGTDGRLRFLGRLKEVIKTKGFTVSPDEVEQILLGHPAVRRACVLGLPDVERDELVLALVVPDRPGETPETAEGLVNELVHHCRARLSSYKVPARFEIVSESDLPLTASGKVSRAALRARLGGRVGSQVGKR